MVSKSSNRFTVKADRRIQVQENIGVLSIESPDPTSKGKNRLGLRKGFETTYGKKALSSIVFFVVLFLLSLIPGAAANDNETEKKFNRAGLVDINSIDSTIHDDLVNSDPDKNYFRENYYGGMKKAYLRKDVAVKISSAQRILRQRQPGYSLLILDAARPRSVSRLMYEKIKGTRFEKFVVNPAGGSMHNYGIAVDLTIVDAAGKEIDMGFAPFRKSTIQIYWAYAKKKLGVELREDQKEKRRLLADTMTSAGFIPPEF